METIQCRYNKIPTKLQNGRTIMEIKEFVQERFYALAPALYVLGMLIKSTRTVNDRFIPIILSIVGIVLAIWLIGFTADAIIQGMLCAGLAVWGNQVLKQMGD